MSSLDTLSIYKPAMQMKGADTEEAAQDGGT